MKHHYTINDRMELIAGDGAVLGRVVEVTFTLEDSPGHAKAEVEELTLDNFPAPLARARPPEGGQTSTATSEATATSKSKSTPLSDSGSIASLSTQEVWDHYVKTFDAGRQKLNPTRRKIIAKALKVATVEECCQAIDGLRRSPHHNGENDRRTKYLDIRFALSAIAKNESVEERIERMGSLAPPRSTATALGKERESNVNVRLRNLRDDLRRYEQQEKLRPGDEETVAELRAKIAELVA